MNQTFDFQRFLLMTRLEIAEKGRNQLLMAGVMVGALLLMMLPIMFSTEYRTSLSELHSLALLLLVLFGGSLYTIQVFVQYDTTNSTIAALMVPASRLEKFLSTLVLNLAFIVPFVLLAWGLHFWTIDYANNHLLSGEDKYERLPGSVINTVITLTMVIQSVVFFGAMYFTKAAYIKTAATFIVIAGLGAAANNYMAQSMMPSSTYFSATPFSSWRIRLNDAGPFYNVDLPESMQLFVSGLPIIIMLALWYITYVRLVEKEV
ncbi:hypothetical protein [Persicitalea jodogahamensis]|uniref:Uncharacterized protein n=1 Tax=Persicitalea jodogahamensis TaxID=402147 RepID=A0A8J3D3N3_9BACT|nr:hypothetical protein [Persicitalea jodogahamensis]GHB65775.1 hypothetical protein GCM10007390_19860 [Persicitalea jodogahamensis]